MGDMGVKAAGQQGKTLTVYIVTRQDAGRVAPEGAGRGLAPAQRGGIDHVVVEEGGGVDELKAGRNINMMRALVPKMAAPEEEGHGAEALATGLHDMRNNVICQGDR